MNKGKDKGTHEAGEYRWGHIDYEIADQRSCYSVASCCDPPKMIQCSSDTCISEPKHIRYMRQPNMRIRVCIYAHTHIQYMRI